tara:strand:+ start:225 stop:884 length:660 start_codon:yes stop_codon:yes gene_type:complete
MIKYTNKLWFLILVYVAVLFLGASQKIFSADTNTVSSTVVTNNTPPTANSPSVVVNNSDICKSAYSGAIQTQVLGISSGVTVRDLNCEMIKLSRSLYGMGMKVAAVSTLCADHRIFDAMWMSATYCPFMGAIGEDAKKGWEENRHLVPAGSKVFLSIEQAEVEQEKVAQELYKMELEEEKKIEQEKQALLNELNQGVHKERNDQIKTFTLGGLALLLLL